MTTEQILNLTQSELIRMTEKDLKKAVSVLRSTSRKRYERVVESGIDSKAMDIIWKSASGETVFPSVRDMDEVTLRNEFRRYKHFLGLKTSTVKGAREVVSSQLKTAREMLNNPNVTEEEARELFRIADELSFDEFAQVMSSTDRIRAVGEVYKPNKDLTREEILQKAAEKLKKLYEQAHPTNPTTASAFFN